MRKLLVTCRELALHYDTFSKVSTGHLGVNWTTRRQLEDAFQYFQQWRQIKHNQFQITHHRWWWNEESIRALYFCKSMLPCQHNANHYFCHSFYLVNIMQIVIFVILFIIHHPIGMHELTQSLIVLCVCMINCCVKNITWYITPGWHMVNFRCPDIF